MNPEPERPRRGKVKDRGAKFNEKHALKYGLSICSRNTRDQSVDMVMCKFCVAFGKESLADNGRKRRATANIKYFRQPFRADHYLSHLEINHKLKWNEYEQLVGVEKENFFATAVHPHLSYLPSNSDSIQTTNESVEATIQQEESSEQTFSRIGPVRLPASDLEYDIIHILVGDVFFNMMDEGISKSQALEIFLPKDDTIDKGPYQSHIKNQRLFDLAIKFIACGTSYRLASRLIQCTKEETKYQPYGGCTEQKVASYIRAVIASNMQRIAWMMRTSWTYTLITEVAIHQSTSYLDVRLRLWYNGGLRDYHLMTIAAFETHSMSKILERINILLSVLDSQWKAKLIGISTYGGIGKPGLLGSQQALATRLTSLISHPGFYFLWSSVYQLELVTKQCVLSSGYQTFYKELIRIVRLIRQQRLVDGIEDGLVLDEMGLDLELLPTKTRGFISMLTNVLKWMMDHKSAVLLVVGTSVSSQWWIYAAMMLRLLSEVVYCIKKLCTMDVRQNSMNDHVQELSKLTLILSDVVGARRDVWDFPTPSNPMAQTTCMAGSFVLPMECIQSFIHQEGSIVMDLFDGLQEMERVHLYKSIGQFAVELCAGIATLAYDGRHYCRDTHGIHVQPPIVHPFSVYAMGTIAFNELISSQMNRLRETFSTEEINQLQKEYYYFTTAVENEPILCSILKKQTSDTDVSFAWSSCLNGRFQLLQEFMGGLASIVPEAQGMEGRFMTELAHLNWEKTSQQNLVDFALEGILHTRQKVKIEVVDLRVQSEPIDMLTLEVE